MDRRLEDVPALKEKFFRKHGLAYYGTGENHDYLSDEALLITEHEQRELLQQSEVAYRYLVNAAEHCLADDARLRRLGVPDFAFRHLRWSWQHERDDYLFGRFDFAGGFDGLPLRLIEFNADTSSLMPETITLGPELLKQAGLKGAHNELQERLTERLRVIAGARGGATAFTAYLGNQDDQLNLDVLNRAAIKAKWNRANTVHLADITFDPEGGMLLDMGNGALERANYLIKFFPWDWIALEEPDLWDLLEEMSRERFLRVLNPAWVMLLQSKALLSVVNELYPNYPLLLPTVNDPAELPNPRAGYVRKPVFGRGGENLMVSLDGRRADAETAGHYGQQPTVYQQLAQFNVDSEGYRYQLSTFVTPAPAAICARRQEGLVIDDEGAEFVPVALS